MNLSLGTCGLNCDSKPTETHFILVCSLRPRIIQNHSVSPVGTIQWPAQLLANDFVKYGIRCSVIPDKRSWCTWCRRLKDTTICNLFMIHPLQTWEIMLGYVNVLWFDMVWYITLHYVGTTLSLSLTMSHYISGWYVRTGIVTASGRSNELVSVVGLGMQCKSVKTEPCLPWHCFGLKVQDPQKETTQIPSNTIKTPSNTIQLNLWNKGRSASICPGQTSPACFQLPPWPTAPEQVMILASFCPALTWCNMINMCKTSCSMVSVVCCLHSIFGDTVFSRQIQGGSTGQEVSHRPCLIFGLAWRKGHVQWLLIMFHAHFSSKLVGEHLPMMSFHEQFVLIKRCRGLLGTSHLEHVPMYAYAPNTSTAAPSLNTLFTHCGARLNPETLHKTCYIAFVAHLKRPQISSNILKSICRFSELIFGNILGVLISGSQLASQWIP